MRTTTTSLTAHWPPTHYRNNDSFCEQEEAEEQREDSKTEHATHREWNAVVEL